MTSSSRKNTITRSGFCAMPPMSSVMPEATKKTGMKIP
jgi:hypothetical protein